MLTTQMISFHPVGVIRKLITAPVAPHKSYLGINHSKSKCTVKTTNPTFSKETNERQKVKKKKILERTGSQQGFPSLLQKRQA